jgi:hypothetical protein
MKDKILVWINSSLVNYGLCKSLQEKYDCELYAIYDITDKPKKYFEIQKIVKFEKSWFYNDLISLKHSKPDIQFLKQFEEKYNINLWLLARNDRIFNEFNDFYDFTEDEILSILEQESRSFDEILDSVNPDYVIIWHPTLQQDYLLYLICKARGIKTLVLRTTRVGKKFIISDNNQDIGFHKINPNVDSDKFSDSILDYHDKFDPQKVTAGFRNRFMSSNSDMISALRKYIFSENTNPDTHYTYFGRTKLKVLLKSFKYEIQTKIRKNFIDKNLIKEIDQKKSFIYFPLHMEQERSTLIDAPFDTDQLQVVKQIVKSLPVGMSLYVKEHPSMKSRNWRSISIYKKLMQLPNVTLLHPSVNPNLLLEKCSLVIVITGTAAFDAGFYGKPAITLVDTEFSSLEHISVLKKNSELPGLIRNCLKKSVNPESMQEYVQYVEKNAILIDMDSLQQDIQDVISYGGYLADVEINKDEFKTLMESKKREFDLLADAHITKIVNK